MMCRARQQGFSLVTALFLLVVFTALGAYMLSISGTQQFITLYALQGTKAYQAARSGIDWGIASTVTGGACPAPATLSPSGGLSGFTVSVNCTSTAHVENGVNINVYVIEAFSQTTSPAFGAPGYASRRLTATITDAP